MGLINAYVLISFFFRHLVTFGSEMTICKDGDYIIDFILSVHDGDWEESEKPFSMKNVLAVETIISVIEDINSDRDLLPNITLGYVIRDDYGSKQRATEIAMSLRSRIIRNEKTHKIRRHRENSKCNPTRFNDHWNNQKGLFAKPVIAVVGGTTSDTGTRIATVLRSIEIPIISYMATSEHLRNDNAFPFLISLLPSDKYQAKAIMDLIDEFKWSYVLALVSTSYYGIEGLAMLEKEAAQRTICLHSRNILIPTGDTSNNTSIRKAVEQIKKDKRLTVVIVFMYLDDVKRLFEEVERQNVTGITWIASEAWAESDAILNFPPHVVLGSLGVKLVSKFSGINKRLCRSPHTKNNIWLTPFLCQYHNISQQNCSVRSLLEKSQINSWCFQSLFPPSMMYIWSFAENAIRTVAQALDDLVSGSTKKTFDYAAMLKSIKSMTFIDSSSRAVSYTNYVGFSVVNYTVVNLQSIDSNGRLKFIQVGSWAKDISKQNKSSKTLVLCKSSIQWNTGQVPQSRCSEPCAGGYKTNPGPHRCCWHCEACPPGHIINPNMSHLCIKCSITDHPNQNRNQCVADTQIFLHYSQPIGIALLAVCSFGEMLGFALFAILRRWKNDKQYIAMPYQSLSFVITALGFLQPLIFLQRTSSSACYLRNVYFLIFLNTHACFLFCSCGRVRHLLVRICLILARLSRRRQKMIRKTWTRSMRINFTKKRKQERGSESNEWNRGVGVGKRRKEKVTLGWQEQMNRGQVRLKSDKAESTVAKKKSNIEEEMKDLVKGGDELNAGGKSSCHWSLTFSHHALFSTALFLSSLPLVIIERDSMIDVTHIKLTNTSNYLFCTFGKLPFIEALPVFHILPLVLTLILTNQKKNMSDSTNNVYVSLFYIHDRFVYYLTYLILLIECTCFPFSFLLPGPREKDILILTVTLVIQYSFVFTTYGTKLYVICREQYKNK